MPELPEVETVCRGLRGSVLDHTIEHVTVAAPPKSIVVSDAFKPKTFADVLRGRTIERVDRHGKNILMRLTGEITLWVHLKMTGRFIYPANGHVSDRHDLVLFDLSNGTRESSLLIFNDYRRFGRLRLFTNDELWLQKGLRELGPDALEITADVFVELCRRRPRQIKPALMDQSFIAGVGNIYADESLWLSRIHPRKLTTAIAPRKLRELHGNFQALMRKAIRLMGTSVDSYAGINGKPGRFQKYLQVYNQAGEPCPRCENVIVREKIGSRSAHFCRSCQRLR